MPLDLFRVGVKLDDRIQLQLCNYVTCFYVQLCVHYTAITRDVIKKELGVVTKDAEDLEDGCSTVVNAVTSASSQIYSARACECIAIILYYICNKNTLS